MTSQVMTVTPDMDIDDATSLMAQEQIRRLPVVEDNQIIGMLSLGDVASDMRFDMEAAEALCEISNHQNLLKCKTQSCPKSFRQKFIILY